MNWWESLTVFEQVFWGIALPSSVLFVIMAILTFVGLGETDADIGDADLDLDGATGGFHLFSLRNFVVFFTMFGWTGIASLGMGAGPAWTIFISLVVGGAMMLLVAYLLYYVSGLVSSGTVTIQKAVGLIGTVYIPVPEGKSGFGKVNVVVQDRKREYKAMTEGPKLERGASVKIKSVEGSQYLLVAKE